MCLSTQAIDIEVAERLVIHSFINLLRRLINCRGSIKSIMIVCEKKFKGTVKKLIVATTKVIEFAVSKKLQQQFSLLAPSHMGGTRERLLITV